MKKRPVNSDQVIPRDVCRVCKKSVGMFDWVINGEGDLVHYPECFEKQKGGK